MIKDIDLDDEMAMAVYVGSSDENYPTDAQVTYPHDDESTDRGPSSIEVNRSNSERSSNVERRQAPGPIEALASSPENSDLPSLTSGSSIRDIDTDSSVMDDRGNLILGYRLTDPREYRVGSDYSDNSSRPCYFQFQGCQQRFSGDVDGSEGFQFVLDIISHLSEAAHVNPPSDYYCCNIPGCGWRPGTGCSWSAVFDHALKLHIETENCRYDSNLLDHLVRFQTITSEEAENVKRHMEPWLRHRNQTQRVDERPRTLSIDLSEFESLTNYRSQTQTQREDERPRTLPNVPDMFHNLLFGVGDGATQDYQQENGPRNLGNRYHPDRGNQSLV